MIEISVVLVGFIFMVVSVYFWLLVMIVIFGYLVNSVVRMLLFGYFGCKIYCFGLYFLLVLVVLNLCFGVWLMVDSIINYFNINFLMLVLVCIFGVGVVGGYNLVYNVVVVLLMKLNLIIICVLFLVFVKIQDDIEKLCVNFYKLLLVVGIINFLVLFGLMVVLNNFVLLVFGEKWNSIILVL